ncbi:MAG: hypothetical protein RL267_316, partial [Chloroflexota bacterium]
MSDAPSPRGAALRSARELAQAISSVERGGTSADALIQEALAQLATVTGPVARV